MEISVNKIGGEKKEKQANTEYQLSGSFIFDRIIRIR